MGDICCIVLNKCTDKKALSPFTKYIYKKLS